MPSSKRDNNGFAGPKFGFIRLDVLLWEAASCRMRIAASYPLVKFPFAGREDRMPRNRIVNAAPLIFLGPT